MKVTLKDIANATDLSLSTVSLALRGEGRISERNRKKILSKASQLGYQSSIKLRKKSNKHPTSIALIMQLEKSEFYPAFFEGFTNASEKRNVEISLFNVSNNSTRVSALISHLCEIGYSAAVIFVPALKRRHYMEILSTVPENFSVISCSNIINPVMDTVTFDAYSGANLVADHFYKQGFRKFGIIEGPQQKPEALFRTNGFTDYTKYKPDSRIVWSFIGDYTKESGEEAFEDFKNQKEKPQAIFAANDAMAFTFMGTARVNGWRIPEDIAVAGYDNLPMCAFHYPQITSVDTDYTALGENALDNLLDRMAKPKTHKGMVSLVPVGLEVRQSSISSTSFNETQNNLKSSKETAII